MSSDPYTVAIDREIFVDDVERYLQVVAEWAPEWAREQVTR